jgi:hypothetical protein
MIVFYVVLLYFVIFGNINPVMNQDLLYIGITVVQVLKIQQWLSSVLDGKEYDVLVCYDDKDSDFVLGMLVPTLETRYDYRCFTHHLGSTDGNFGTTCKLTQIVKSSKGEE